MSSLSLCYASLFALNYYLSLDDDDNTNTNNLANKLVSVINRCYNRLFKL